MKKQLTIILITIAMLFLIGQGCSYKKGDESVKVEKYHTGTNGVIINFVANAPPYRIYDNNNMKIALEIRNKGACDITKNSLCYGYVQIEGFDQTIFQGFSTQTGFLPYDNVYSKEIPEIPGQSVFNPDGSYDVVTFPREDISITPVLPDNVDKYKPTILAKACYTYITDATAIVCVDPNPYGVNLEDKVCTMKDVSLTGGQGAPVAVTKVEEELITAASGQKYLQFKIYVKNVGGGGKTSKTGKGSTGRGDVVSPWAVFKKGMGGCGTIDYTNRNRVFITGELSREGFYNCRPEGSGGWLGGILLDESGSGFIMCNADLPATQSAYTAPLHIQLYYGYVSTVSTTVEVVQTPGE